MIRVAVIGAGASGLCALRHLTCRPSVFTAVAFEQNDRVGGTWVYADGTGTDQNGFPMHSSMYKNLRTNLPKESMAFPDFPFDKSLPSFIHHTEMLQYLEYYACHFKLYKFIKFQTRVVQVEPCSSGNGTTMWTVAYRSVTEPNGALVSQVFDAVFVCNGHYSVPLIPEIKGMDKFQGLMMHSHCYREPEPFAGQCVVCLGAGASGQDIALEIATKAKQVFLCHNHKPLITVLPENLVQKPGVKRLSEKTAMLDGDEEVEVDALVLCTGYCFSFPFLSPNCLVEIKDERILPLYKHVIHTQFPSMFFIGICKTICPFPQFQCQVKLAEAVLDGTLNLPTKEKMDGEIEADYQCRLASGLPHRHMHTMGDRQWEYNDELATMAQAELVPRYVVHIYEAVHKRRQANIAEYKKFNYKVTGPDSFRELD